MFSQALPDEFTVYVLEVEPAPGQEPLELPAAEAFHARYALDGNNPNSYGGLLYCLGLFDRPFTPEQPVFGAVRTRSTRKHREALDLDAYRARMNTRSEGGFERVAVIGAGIAGLSAARALGDQGFNVTVLERAEKVGGRTAHRRIGALHFDHGAQYFTARDPRFARYVSSWLEAGLVARWDGRIVAFDEKRRAADVSPLDRFVGVPGMTAMARHLADGVDVRLSSAVRGLRRESDRWRIETKEKSLGPFDALVVAMPPEQIRLLSAPEVLLDASKEFDSLPCWCAMAAFDAPLPVEFDGAFVNGDAVDWIARDSSKPERSEGERWVIHATASWSGGRLEESAEDIAHLLLDEFFDALGIGARDSVHLEGHRWSFAKPASEGELNCIWLPEQAAVLCGDWCRGGRVEGAFLSGLAAAG